MPRCKSAVIVTFIAFLATGAIANGELRTHDAPLPRLDRYVSAGNWSLNAFDARRVLEATSASFERILTDFQNTSFRNYVSQCLLDFAALFNTPGKNYFQASKGLEAVDALGKPGSNIIYGNIQMWGAFDECLSIGEGLIQYWLVPINIYLQLSPAVQPIIITPLPIRWGMCVPRSCDSTDLQYFLNITNTYLHNIINDTSLNIAANYDDVEITTSKTRPLTSGAVAMIVVCAVFLALALVGSAAEMGEKYLPRKSEIFLLDRSSEEPSESSPLIHTNSSISSSLKKSLEYVTAFSLFKNVKIILSTHQPPSVITSLNGIRVISMFWIIIHHTKDMFYISNAFTNPLYLFKYIEIRFSSQVINNRIFSVDSFFLLGGILVAYHNLREMEKRRGRFPVITYYLHRYLRLTMVYAFVLFFWWTLMEYLGSGPGWQNPVTGLKNGCHKYWWTNLLYINNLYPWELSSGCMAWTWYLATDMQFYILAPLILIPLYHIFRVGIILSIVLLAGTLCTIGAIVGTEDFSARLDLSRRQLDDVYSKPYTRAAPYIVGLMLGFLLYKKVRINFHWFVDWFIYCAMWVVAAGCCFSVVYGLYSSFSTHELTRVENVSYGMFSRFTWSVGVALMVFACHNGYGWVINDFLSMKVWIPLSRLTYSAYLIHPLVVESIEHSLREPVTYTDYTIAVYIVATVVLSYGAAGVVAVFVEFPLSGLETLVFKALGLNRRQSTNVGNGTTKEAPQKKMEAENNV